MSTPGTTFKLLLVEDNPGDADLARERLSDIPDYAFEINTVTRLADAIDVLRDDPVDAVILDLNLPDSHGLDTLRRLRKVRREMAIIVLSGAADDALRQQAMDAGAQEFLSKSEPTSRLVARSFLYAVERHRVEEQRKQIERIVAANPDAVIVVDHERIVRFANSAALSLFGRKEEDFVGRPLGHEITENDVSDITFEKDKRTHTAEMRAATFEWNGNAALLASIRDTTEQKLMAEQLLQAQKMEALGLLAGGVAHDFNNLLTVIVNCATFVAESVDATDPAQHDVKQILAASERAEALVAQLLALSRRKPTQPRALDLSEMVADLEPLLRRTLPADIELQTKVPNGLWPVMVDPARLEQVLMNLAVNAKDAMPKGGRLTITLANQEIDKASEVRPAGDYVAIAVADTGTGMAPEIVSRIFDPFFTTKAPGKGTGLGLATSYAIVRQAGGDISVDSKPGAGTAFTVMLPRSSTLPSETGKETDDAEDFAGAETILVVEDDPDVRAMTVTLLSKYGYLVISAGDGEEGLNLAETYGEDIDLVLSDIVMPRMNGHDLAKALQMKRPRIKVLLMSGYDENQDGSGEGPAILFKPFRPRGLLRRVRETLEG
jgi:signal transduction histidine kinase/DNA-binding response OmpR family regulator